MFNDSQFNGDISKWKTHNVTDMNSMFKNSQFNGDISGWHVENVIVMFCMFEDSQFTGDISKWVLNTALNTSYMFEDSKFGTLYSIAEYISVQKPFRNLGLLGELLKLQLKNI